MKKQMTIVALLTLSLFFGNATTATAADKYKVYTVDQIMAKASSLVGQTVHVKGICKHVCATTGRKLFLLTADGTKLIRINAGTKIDKFDAAARGKEVVATGVVTEHRTTLADLDKQETLALEAEKKQAKQEHCTTEAKANGENEQATPVQRIREQKTKLQQQIAKGGKDYFATYTIDDCNDYTVAK
jgi:hypothetical protein